MRNIREILEAVTATGDPANWDDIYVSKDFSKADLVAALERAAGPSQLEPDAGRMDTIVWHLERYGTVNAEELPFLLDTIYELRAKLAWVTGPPDGKIFDPIRERIEAQGHLEKETALELVSELEQVSVVSALKDELIQKDPDKWSWAALVYVAWRMLMEIYPESVFKRNFESTSNGLLFLTHLRSALEALGEHNAREKLLQQKYPPETDSDG